MATDTVTETLPAPIQAELAKLDKARETLIQRVPDVQIAERILGEHRQSERDCVELNFALIYEVQITLHVTHWRQVVPLLRALAKEGYHRAEAPWDFFERDARVWGRTRTRPEPSGRIVLWAYLPYDGSGECRRVKVGEKTEDVYDWECDNGDEHDGRPVDTDGPA